MFSLRLNALTQHLSRSLAYAGLASRRSPRLLKCNTTKDFRVRIDANRLPGQYETVLDLEVKHLSQIRIHGVKLPNTRGAKRDPNGFWIECSTGLGRLSGIVQTAIRIGWT